jgi:hypothetical protein
MANTYTWDCRTVDAYPTHTDENGVTETKVVYNVHWRVTGSNGTNETTVIGTQSLETADLSGFTSFENVTHDDMITWTKAAMTTEKLTQIETSLDTQLAELAAPTSVTLIVEDPSLNPVE